ncbi:hypothetical protein H0H81_004467, partial [Sphagnurus paluster]
DIEPRVIGGRVAGTVVRNGANAIKSSARVASRPPLRIPQPMPQPMPQPASGISGKQVTSGLVVGKLFGSKVVGGTLVGLGSLGAQAADNGIAGEKRDLEPRNGAVRAGLQIAKTASNGIGRTAIRPNTVSRITNMRPAQVPAPPRISSNLASKFKTGGAITAIGLTAGAGEYAGGQTMGNMIDRLEGGGNKRRNIGKELWSRNLAIKAAKQVAAPAFRAARTGGTRGVVHAIPIPQPVRGPSVVGKLGKGTLIGTAAATGGFAEGMIQNVTPETQQKLVVDPKGTISKMLPPSPFAGRSRREYFEGLMSRGGNTESVEQLVARAFIDMLEELD